MLNRILRTGVAAAAILGALATPVTAAESERESANAALTNPLLYAIAWRQTAAEFRALYYQGFALAQLRVEQALAARGASASNDTRPLAVITDVDETVLLSGAYWGQLIAEGGDFFDDATWDAWVPNNEFVASPGAREFAAFCEANGVSLIASLGDNLNDFARRYYVIDVAEREALMHADAARFGTDYIVFPNPTDGHWIRAIFGESEPAPTEAKRRILRAAAVGR